MKERRFYKTLIGSCVLMLCMAVAMIFTVFRADASDESKTIKYESLSMSSYWSTTEKTAPTKEGYVFGGWYTKSGDTYTALKAADVTTSSDGKANVSDTYAKFVPKEVLDIKAQVSDTLFDDVTTNDGTAAIRFVTSLDNSMSYQKVGFNIKKGSTGTAADADTTDYVYRTLYAVGATDGSGKAEEYKPEDLFHSESYYFKTWTITNIGQGAYNTDVTVIPYWITLDGTRVEGTKAIKTVNLGRSWVYVDNTANATDGEEYGTRKHPYTDFSKALDTIFVADKGKVIAKAGCNLENPDTFTWDAHNVGMITVTAEDTDSYIGFDVVPDMEINDDVTFENMKLQFAKHVYAKGHHFKVADSVNLINDDTTLSGGGKTASVDSTNIEIYAGSWLVIYGSSEQTAGSVKGDTHITIGGNTQIKHASSGSQNMIFGGGKSDVGGSTYVTVGGTFNSGLNLSDHTALSTVYGGGRGTGEVAKDTNIVFKDSAMTTYIYGGGAKGTKVLGTCHVTMNGGNVMSIWGGGATMDNTETKQNADTSVVVNAGTVEQIFGGNGSGMTGNTYVEVSGGTITRRIYGGCYHDETTTTAYVKGTTNVIINDPDALQLNKNSSIFEKDNSLCTGSRYAGNQAEEIGTLIFNNGTYETYKNKIGENASSSVSVKNYDYLVKATTGGKVATEDMMLCVTPVEANPGTVTINDTVQYFKGAGSCKMPEITETTPKYTVDVVFNATDAQSQIEACEARIDGMYYDTFINAVNSAKTRNTKPTVTVMRNCTVNTAIINAAGEEYAIVGDGNTKKVITVNSGVSELFQVRGKIKLDNLEFTGGQSIVRNYAGTLTLDNIEMHDIAGVGIYHENGTTYAYNTTISNAVKFGVLVVKGTANIDNVNISGITGTDNRDAINVQGGKLNIYNTKSPYNGVTISNVAQRNGIHVTGGEVYADAVTITDIKTGHGIYVQKGSVKIDQLNVGAENGAIKKAALYMTGSNQAEAIISNFTASHIGAQVVYLEGNTSAEITNFNLTSSTDTGVRTKGTASVILEDGTITAANGRYGVYASDTSTVTATDVSIVRNVAMASGVDSLVYVNTGSTITLKEDDGTSMIQGNSELAGKGVVVKGTFNLEGGTITGHKLASTDNKGAGVHVQAGGVFNMSGGSVTGNTAVNGGGVALEGTVATDEVEAVSAMFYMNGGSIESNSATTDGAGVAVHTSGTFTMKGGNIQENTAPAGGGVSVNGTNATFTLENGNISQNTVTNDGGGVYLLTGGSFTMTGGSIQGNSAGANRGGGVCLYADDASFTLKNGTISGNTARAGGAVIVRKGSFSMDGGSITGNFANANTGSNGGAIYLSSGKNFTMNGGEITSNTATNLGGAIYTEGKSTITLGAGKLSGNTAKTGNNFGVHCVGTGASKGTLIIKAPFVLVDLYNGNFELDDQRTTE